MGQSLLSQHMGVSVQLQLCLQKHLEGALRIAGGLYL